MMRIIEVENFEAFSELFSEDRIRIVTEDDPINLWQTRDFVFRGQADNNWKLEPTLERLLDRARRSGAKISSRAAFVDLHLKNFRQAIRGRRGSNPVKLGNTDAWALGQHFGLATPLLDWSLSPYIALFFAFASHKESDHFQTVGNVKRSVWCLNRSLIERRQTKALEEAATKERDGIQLDDPHAKRHQMRRYRERNSLQFVIPEIDENERLIVQSGLFTFSTSGKTVDDWVHEYMLNEDQALVRIDIDDHEGQRRRVLKSLDLMNINHASLFPDLSGACDHVNSMSEDFH